MEHGDCQLNRAARFAHFTELSILIVQLVVEFTKQLPGFLSVSREDQVGDYSLLMFQLFSIKPERIDLIDFGKR